MFVEISSDTTVGANIAAVDVGRSTVYNYVKDGKAAFNTFIQKWFASLGKKNDYILHYVPLATAEGRKDYPMPTVAPTDIAFQNYGFCPDLPPKSSTGGNENNMLVYLQATGGTALPNKNFCFR